MQITKISKGEAGELALLFAEKDYVVRFNNKELDLNGIFKLGINLLEELKAQLKKKVNDKLPVKAIVIDDEDESNSLSDDDIDLVSLKLVIYILNDRKNKAKKTVEAIKVADEVQRKLAYIQEERLRREGKSIETASDEDLSKLEQDLLKKLNNL